MSGMITASGGRRAAIMALMITAPLGCLKVIGLEEKQDAVPFIDAPEDSQDIEMGDDGDLEGDEAAEVDIPADDEADVPDDAGQDETTSCEPGAVAIAAGSDHTCALLETGAVYCWGDNAYGQLGDGTYEGRLSPVPVSGLAGEATDLAAFAATVCAVLDSGGAVCWGRNDHGQVGDGTLADKNLPVGVGGLSSGVAAISAGGSHACAVSATGTVRCWGRNNFGQIGDGTTTDRYVPTQVSGLPSAASGVSAGAGHTCALLTDGGVLCWGYNGFGQLGDGTTTSRNAPVPVSGLSSGVVAIAAGAGHTCALLAGGGIMCWGYNGEGELGDGTTENALVPVEVLGLSSEAEAVSVGNEHTCALLSTGEAECWGGNSSGQLGIGTTETRYTPAPVTGLSGGVTAIDAGSGYHTCAAAQSGVVLCWGKNDSGQLGDGTRTQRSTPAGVPCF